MNITRLVCEACGAAIESSVEESMMICPYCGSRYFLESSSIGGGDKRVEMIRQLLSREEKSKFPQLDQAIQDTMIHDLIRLVEQNRLIDSIRNVRIYTGLGLREAKEIVEKIQALLIK